MLHRGTPLYGQPAWWGDGDTEDQHPGKSEDKSSDRKREKVEAGTNNYWSLSVYFFGNITNIL